MVGLTVDTADTVVVHSVVVDTARTVEAVAARIGTQDHALVGTALDGCSGTVSHNEMSDTARTLDAAVGQASDAICMAHWYAFGSQVLAQN